MIRLDAPGSTGRPAAVASPPEKRPEATAESDFAVLLAVVMGPASPVSTPLREPSAVVDETGPAGETVAVVSASATQEVALPEPGLWTEMVSPAAWTPGTIPQAGGSTAGFNLPVANAATEEAQGEVGAPVSAGAAPAETVPQGAPWEEEPRPAPSDMIWIQKLLIERGFEAEEGTVGTAEPPEEQPGSSEPPLPAEDAAHPEGQPLVVDGSDLAGGEPPVAGAQDAKAAADSAVPGEGFLEAASGKKEEQPAGGARSRSVPEDAEPDLAPREAALSGTARTLATQQGTAAPAGVPKDPAPTAPVRTPYLTEEPVSPDRVMDLVVESLQDTPDGEYAISLRLHPEHLGEVRLQLQLSGREVQTRFEVTTTEARLLLEQRGEQLREGLQNAGFTLSGFTVSTGGGTRQGRERWDLEEWLWQGRPETPPGTTRIAGSQGRRAAPARHAGLLDRWA